MTFKKNRYSTLKATKKGCKTIYLCWSDEEKGLDGKLDLLGYTVTLIEN